MYILLCTLVRLLRISFYRFVSPVSDLAQRGPEQLRPSCVASMLDAAPSRQQLFPLPSLQTPLNVLLPSPLPLHSLPPLPSLHTATQLQNYYPKLSPTSPSAAEELENVVNRSNQPDEVLDVVHGASPVINSCIFLCSICHDPHMQI